MAGRQQGFDPPKQPVGGHLAEASAGAPVRSARMYLQGIEPAARLQLLALCLASLERQTSLLRELNIRYSRGARGGGESREGRGLEKNLGFKVLGSVFLCRFLGISQTQNKHHLLRSSTCILLPAHKSTLQMVKKNVWKKRQKAFTRLSSTVALTTELWGYFQHVGYRHAIVILLFAHNPFCTRSPAYKEE